VPAAVVERLRQLRERRLVLLSFEPGEPHLLAHELLQLGLLADRKTRRCRLQQLERAAQRRAAGVISLPADLDRHPRGRLHLAHLLVHPLDRLLGLVDAQVQVLGEAAGDELLE